ncbi:MAG: DUF2149 domain-containing protein [Clostridiales Family XIII bacterium]|jgi:hypothetical protein|nr:DUF2149 domain-containing protein [Clostridiales Family XIII bacterium]
MLRDGGLRGRRRYFEQEDANPMEGAINIVDAMLVFACGLMLSLVLYWNVDIQNKELVAVEDSEGMSEMNDVSQDMQDKASSEGEFQRMGTVYVDPSTGKMYLVQDVPEGSQEVAESNQDAAEGSQEVADETVDAE